MTTGGFDIWRFHLAAGYRLSRHAHEVTGFALCIDGEYQARVSRKLHRLRPGDIMVLAKDVEHEEFTQVETDCLIVAPNPERGEPPAALEPRMQGFSLHPGRVVHANLYRLWFELVADDDSSPVEAGDATGAILRDWIGQESSPPPRGQGWLDRAEKRLRGCFTEPGVVSRTAVELNVSAEHLVRAFRARFGITPGQLVRYRRMMVARRALTETDVPIAQIALDSGFADQSHLTRLFRMFFGTTPKVYRRGLSPLRP